ncbi:HsdM family class I SAM-dependent methyltransferase [Faecalispora anaeroviscerum]|uniref:HsdM family class I SAM-dependent methyltransferase n=1 Tax=Faecalispora anaeroviscerum TaxID=2991836 RepID=UPI0024B8A760|nr:N-6 DNA methylase [Faecalispora anaeroviscerum]
MNAKELLRLIPKKHSDLQIEASLIRVFLEQYGLSSAAPTMLNELQEKAVPEVCRLLHKEVSLTLPLMKSVLEEMVDLQERGKNGVVFTPHYIADYILKHATPFPFPEHCRVIDPACGSGSFLLPAAEVLHRISGKPMREIISEHLYGIDISEDQTRRSRVLLTLLALLTDGTADGLSFHIATADSLSCDWTDLFGCADFDAIVGNPPYLNTHTIPQKDAERLKKSFLTTRKGTFNLFYAFIEQSLRFLSKRGTLGFIVPNNYLSISSAEELRRLLGENRAVSRVIDFGENLVFEPIHTYSSLLFLNRRENHTVAYAALEKSENLPEALSRAILRQTDWDGLNPAGWKFLSETERQNIERIEQAGQPIRNQIKIGIATLRDSIYFLDGFDANTGLFYQERGGVRYWIEPGAVRAIDKISELSNEAAMPGERKHILFPYTGTPDDGTPYRILEEEQLAAHFPLCYQYLLDCRPVLAARDKGKPNPVAWYAYGRSQGLNCRGPKLLFPMFSRKPKFLPEPDGEILFCNGYAITQGGRYPLEVLAKILNSDVMEYYISRVSYCLKGDYKCYQKKYLRNFSIPEFSEAEIRFLLSESSPEEIDSYLFEKYRLLTE